MAAGSAPTLTPANSGRSSSRGVISNQKRVGCRSVSSSLSTLAHCAFSLYRDCLVASRSAALILVPAAGGTATCSSRITFPSTLAALRPLWESTARMLPSGSSSVATGSLYSVRKDSKNQLAPTPTARRVSANSSRSSPPTRLIDGKRSWYSLALRKSPSSISPLRMATRAQPHALNSLASSSNASRRVSAFGMPS